MAKANRISQLTMNEASPEKAGVGGSIPSLATTSNPSCFKHLLIFVWIATLCETASVESIWSPNSSRLRSW
jgi:hypothetical protein